MKRYLIHTIIIISVLSSCVKETEWEMTENSKDYIVVDAILTNEYKVQQIYIHHSKARLNDISIPVSGAEVIINTADETYQLNEDPANPGRYITDTIVVARFSKNYSLLIYYQDRFYNAQAYMLPGKTFPELTYDKNNDNGLYYIDYVASSFEAEDPAMWEILIDWSFVPGYENYDPDACKKRLLFYTLPTLDISQVFAPLVEKVYFPAGTRIIERRYSLTKEHAAFIRTLLQETNWQGGVFPSDPANVITNLSGGAWGFFGICAVNSLSLTVTP